MFLDMYLDMHLDIIVSRYHGSVLSYMTNLTRTIPCINTMELLLDEQARLLVSFVVIV